MKSSKSKNLNGEGTIYFDKKGNRWRAEIQWSDNNGKKHKKKFSGQKRVIVKNKLDDFKRELLIANGSALTGDNVLFKEFAEYWLESILKNKLKPTSFLRKQVTLNNQVYPYLGDKYINEITHYDVQNMVNTLNEKGLSYSSVKKAFEAVNGCIREYRIKNRISFNPCEGISLPTNKQKDVSDITFFNDEQRIKIRNEAGKTYKNGKPIYRLGQAIVVLMYTGMRVGELLALTWDDVNFEEKIITINKNAVMVRDNSQETNYRILTQNSAKTRSGSRIIPMSNMAFEALRKIYEINGSKEFVMSTKSGKQITPANIDRMFHKILKNSGVATSDNDLCGVHTLRHTFASMLFNNGCDTKIVSEILGHSSTKITENIYIHVIQKQKVKAIQDIDKYSD